MLCSADKGSGQEGVALELTMKAVFDRLGDVRPNAIVIDKSNTEYNALMKVIEHDKFCWMKNDNHIIQTHCHLLLCWFHAKKAWVENLLPKLAESRRSTLYTTMCGLMESRSEEQFNQRYEEFKKTYANDEMVLAYVEEGWARGCKWRKMWPLYNRMFEHRFVNTTNLVERLWQYIKYTLLKKQVNRRLDTLVWALIGE
jgi:hypothetical protein